MKRFGPVILLLILFVLVIRFGLSLVVKEEPPGVNFQHPRGLVRPEQLGQIRERLSKEPYQTFFAAFKQNVQNQVNALDSAVNPDIYDLSYAASNLAALYLLTDDQKWADRSWEFLTFILEDSDIFNDPLSRGLTRATILQRAAYCYDFCFAAWDQERRRQVAEKLYRVMFNTNANMGFSANYSLASNWMGVRYGSVFFTSMIWDEFANDYDRPRDLPLRWDATNRMLDHLEANIFVNGWNGESMGYHNYDWTFIAPALVAFSNRNFPPEPVLSELVPQAVNSLRAQITATVNIPTRGSRGIGPDLSDDNLTSSLSAILPFGFRLYPDDQIPAIKWMHDYLIDPKIYEDPRGYFLSSILYYPENTEAINPEEYGWLNYHDPDQGIVIFRNRFKDENDIVATYNATQNRVKGHRGPDTNTFRLTGLGVPWIIGGGRTGEIAGQTNLFPHQPEAGESTDLVEGELYRYSFEENGSGFAIGGGSTMGVDSMKRTFKVKFPDPGIAEAVIVIADQSLNGKVWRINTPEFNQLQMIDSGYRLIGPNQSSMQVKVFNSGVPLQIETGELRYGGNTTNNNPGIIYRNNVYENSRFIDVFCDQNITVVITLQKEGRRHPDISKTAKNQYKVGNILIDIPEL